MSLYPCCRSAELDVAGVSCFSVCLQLASPPAHTPFGEDKMTMLRRCKSTEVVDIILPCGEDTTSPSGGKANRHEARRTLTTSTEACRLSFAHHHGQSMDVILRLPSRRLRRSTLVRAWPLALELQQMPSGKISCNKRLERGLPESCKARTGEQPWEGKG
jgi:hypothetical protein